ncbi:hypothetical protein BDZ91DRAFT_786210 [Kalaharituber pfeilii]|nr:hypothetical protein BDZ91DRAFT_786210 [Kalaharituber pfeilii]
MSFDRVAQKGNGIGEVVVYRSTPSTHMLDVLFLSRDMEGKRELEDFSVDPKSKNNPIHNTHSFIKHKEMEGTSITVEPSHAEISVHTYTIAGIQTHIYGLTQLAPLLTSSSSSSSPPPPAISILWTLHPRLQTHEYMAPIIRACLADHYFPSESSTAPDDSDANSTSPPPPPAEPSSPPRPALLGVSFDQRNHGTREAAPLANLAFSSPPPPHPHHHSPNPAHAIDMYSIFHGTAVDLALLITYIRVYLEFHFNPPVPMTATTTTTLSKPRKYISIPTIRDNIVLGVSLGGHSAYLAALHIPQVNAAISVIGCADYPALMTHRLRQCKLLAPPELTGYPNATGGYLPPSFMSMLASTAENDGPSMLLAPPSPHVCPVSLLKGKKLLVLSGKEDKLVPPRFSKGFLDRVREGMKDGEELAGTGAEVKEVVFEGVGHEFGEGMGSEVRRFVARVVGR